MSGQKIINGLKDAIAGNLSRVTVEGQTWERVGLQHKTRQIQVWVDVDMDIADVVIYLNTISGVRTIASCQGTIGEGGPHPYRAQVMVTWTDDAAFSRLKNEFDLSEIGNHWCYVHPRDEAALKRR